MTRSESEIVFTDMNGHLIWVDFMSGWISNLGGFPLESLSLSIQRKDFSFLKTGLCFAFFTGIRKQRVFVFFSVSR